MIPADELPDDREGRLELLVRWLAAPYADNLPVFATELPDGRPLLAGLALEKLFTEVMGDQVGTRHVSGAWWRCPSCDLWQIRSDLGPQFAAQFDPRPD